MGFRCGIVGLSNVGKSTLFNALASGAVAETANYPFTTIEPNVGRVAVPDPRLDAIARLAGSATVTPANLEFVDIAGLVRGASRGEGLGNQFLAHIREVDAILHVLRCFESAEVAHHEETIDPVRDAELVETELMLADLESVERRRETASKKARGGDKEEAARIKIVERALDALGDGRPVREVARGEEEAPDFKALRLLTDKPVLYACNVEEDAAAGGNSLSDAVAARAQTVGAGCVVISAAIEAEIAALDDAEAAVDFLASMGLEEPGLVRLVHAGYALLDLITFFTANPNEARAWTIRRGARARAAAAMIHTDFARGFICAETISYDGYVACGGEHGARDQGKLRSEGKEYVVQDGDVIRFRFNL